MCIKVEADFSSSCVLYQYIRSIVYAVRPSSKFDYAGCEEKRKKKEEKVKGRVIIAMRNELRMRERYFFQTITYVPGSLSICTINVRCFLYWIYGQYSWTWNPPSSPLLFLLLLFLFLMVTAFQSRISFLLPSSSTGRMSIDMLVSRTGGSV